MNIVKTKSESYKHEIVKNYLQENESKPCKILDIGCEVPVALFDLDIEYSIEKFCGLDILQSKFDLIKRYWYLQNIPHEIVYKTIKDCYVDYLRNNGALAGLPSSIIEQKIKSYENRFSILTGFNCLDLNKNISEEFDILFGVGLLHFIKFNKAIEFIQDIPNYVKSDGLIVLTVNHEENFSMNDTRYSEKIGKRSFRQKDLNEVVHLFDDHGFLKIIEKLESFGIRRLVLEKYKNHQTQTFEDYLYIGKKIVR